MKPVADLIETDTGYTFDIDMPGVKKEDLNIKLEKETLTVEGKVAVESDKETKSIYKEYEPGVYIREFTLTPEMDRDSIKANLEDGVLRITLKKHPDAEPKKIYIN